MADRAKPLPPEQLFGRLSIAPRHIATPYPWSKQNPRTHELAGKDGLQALAALFLVVGLFRIAVALVDYVPSWGWLLFNGVVTVVLGLAIWQQWPESGLRVVGMLVGIELIMNGVTWSVLAVGERMGSP